jgi:hypothetical protein
MSVPTVPVKLEHAGTIRRFRSSDIQNSYPRLAAVAREWFAPQPNAKLALQYKGVL